MSTRGLMIVKYEGKYAAWYNHGDSYPAGLGESLAAYLRRQFERRGKQDAMKYLSRKVARLKAYDSKVPPTPEQVDSLILHADGSPKGKNWDWYWLLRETQGDLGACLQAGYYDQDAIHFIRDSLFCEWAYCVDLDAKQFETYRGSQKKPHKLGQFCDLEPAKRLAETVKVIGQYYPCALLYSCALERIPKTYVRVVNYKYETLLEGEEGEG